MSLEHLSIDTCPTNLLNAVDAVVAHFNQINESQPISREDFQFTRKHVHLHPYQYFATLSIENLELHCPRYPLANKLIMGVINNRLNFSLYFPNANIWDIFDQDIDEFSGSGPSLAKLKSLLTDLFKKRRVEKMSVEHISIDTCPTNLLNAVDAVVAHFNQINEPLSISREDFQFTRKHFYLDSYQYFATLSIENLELRCPRYPLAIKLIMGVRNDRLNFSLYFPNAKIWEIFNRDIDEFSGSGPSLAKLKILLTDLFNGKLEERVKKLEKIVKEGSKKKEEEVRIENETMILKEAIRSESQQWAVTNLSTLADNLNKIPNINHLENYTIKNTVQEALRDVILSKGLQEWYHGPTGQSIDMLSSSPTPNDGSLRSSSAARMLQALERLSLLG